MSLSPQDVDAFMRRRCGGEPRCAGCGRGRHRHRRPPAHELARRHGCRVISRAFSGHQRRDSASTLTRTSAHRIRRPITAPAAFRKGSTACCWPTPSRQNLARLARMLPKGAGRAVRRQHRRRLRYSCRSPANISSRPKRRMVAKHAGASMGRPTTATAMSVSATSPVFHRCVPVPRRCLRGGGEPGQALSPVGADPLSPPPDLPGVFRAARHGPEALGQAARPRCWARSPRSSAWVWPAIGGKDTMSGSLRRSWTCRPRWSASRSHMTKAMPAPSLPRSRRAGSSAFLLRCR